MEPTQVKTIEEAEKRASRAAALQREIDALGAATLATPWARGIAPLRTWLQSAPFLHIRRRMERFRLPRSIKSDLMDRFCSDEAGVLSRVTTLVVVAHPDDESIGAGARLRHLGDAFVVNVTDGAPRDPACAIRHGFATRDEYAAARAEELREAMRIVGLPDGQLISLGYVDGEVSLHLTELVLRLTDLMDTLKPQVVLTHPYEGGHTDHDSTTFAVHLACGVLRREGIVPPAILELTSYHLRGGEKVVQEFLPHERADRDQRVIVLDARDQEIKERVFDAFGTQRELLETFNTSFERFRPAPRYVFTRPPHPGLLNYERYGATRRGLTWREHAQRALRALRMRRTE